LVAIDSSTGERLWQKEIGGEDTPWIAGDYIFVLTKTAQIVTLDLKSGRIRWVYDLPRFEDPVSKDSSLFWKGPVLAGGVLRIAGTDGRMIDMNPETGEKLGMWSIGAEPAVPMVVADETLFILDGTGTLSAWR
jgi:outer membrane protein assembly factor BamB